MRCRRCGKEGCRVSAHVTKQGKNYSALRGLVGAMLFGDGGIGLGMTGSRYMEVGTSWTCPNCGFKFTDR